ncbi:GntR family transcriptional regulator [Geminicoccaceae bacterium 1502E]|nr:GntR family transcriptional regulator [Geminicoccaceae bacterium 1502E]
MPQGAAGADPITPASPGRCSRDARIYRELLTAIVDNRIPPGTALPEDTLAAAFAASRTVVRKALLRLGHEKLVELRPNRGATVARPSVEEARQVFEARRLVEAAIVGGAVEHGTDAELARLRAGLAREHAAERQADRHEVIRLSGDFHRELASIAGNQVLGEFLGELVSRTSLILALYQPPGTVPCSHDEHLAVLEAIERRDPARARERMAAHLAHVERLLRLDKPKRTVDLHALFADARQRHRAGGA